MRIKDINEGLDNVEESLILSPRTVSAAIQMYKELNDSKISDTMAAAKSAGTHGIDTRRFMKILKKQGLMDLPDVDFSRYASEGKVDEAKKRKPKVKADPSDSEDKGTKGGARDFTSKHLGQNKGSAHKSDKDYKRKPKHNKDRFEEESSEVPDEQIINWLRAKMKAGDIHIDDVSVDPHSRVFRVPGMQVAHVDADIPVNINDISDYPVDEGGTEVGAGGRQATMKTKPSGYLKGQKFVG